MDSMRVLLGIREISFPATAGVMPTQIFLLELFPNLPLCRIALRLGKFLDKIDYGHRS